jgi:hypothetical protein
VSARSIRLTLRKTPRPGWSFLCGGGGPDGMFLTQEDEQGDVWLTRMWSLGPIILSLDVFVPWPAMESIATRWALREAKRRAAVRAEREDFDRWMRESDPEDA